MNPHVNFKALWTLMVGVAENVNNERMKATLLNHANKKEYICRKLGIISSADVKRFQDTLQYKKSS